MNEFWIVISGIIGGIISLALNGLFNMRRATAEAEKVKAEARAVDANSTAVLQASYGEALKDQRLIIADLQAGLTAVKVELASLQASYGENTKTLLMKIDGLEALVKELKDEIRQLNQQLATEKAATAAAIADKKGLSDN